MLDPNNDFNSPCYDDAFRRNFYFAEFNAYNEYFIELDYWIMREAFVSRIGSPLNLNQKHYDDGDDGEEIFRDISSSERELFKLRNYFLADEIIDISTSSFGDIYKVTEVYAYAPQTNGKSTVFQNWISEVVTFPKLVNFDHNYSKTYIWNQLSYLCGLDEVGFVNSDLDIGDEFYLDRPQFNLSSTVSACRSSMLTVSRREGDKLWAKASTFTNPYSGATWTPKDIIFNYRNSTAGWTYLKQPTKTFASRTLQVSIRKETTFHTAKPEISERFFPKNKSGLEVEQIDSGTLPTYIQYNQMIVDKEEIRPQPSNITEVFKGLWKKEDFFCEAK